MKVKYTALMADARGKLNGSVASKNRGGAYIRTKVTPSNPQSTLQAAVRSSLAEFASGWRSLTAVQRSAWNAAVTDFAKTDIFGDLRNPSGINLYAKLNIWLLYVAGTTLVLPPLPGSVTNAGSATAVSDVSDSTVTVTPDVATVPAGMDWVLSATPQMSAGKSSYKSKYARLVTVAAAGTAFSNAFAAYTAKYGGLVAGKKIGFKIEAVNHLTGQVSPPIFCDCIITA